MVVSFKLTSWPVGSNPMLFAPLSSELMFPAWFRTKLANAGQANSKLATIGHPAFELRPSAQQSRIVRGDKVSARCRAAMGGGKKKRKG